MSAIRRRQNETWDPLLPWESTPGADSGPSPTLHERDQPDRPILYGPKGEPLTRVRHPFGFRPPERR